MSDSLGHLKVSDSAEKAIGVSLVLLPDVLKVLRPSWSGLAGTSVP